MREVVRPDDPSLESYYTRSLLRATPYFLFLLIPVRHVLDAVGDIVFYVTPTGGTSARSKLSGRLLVRRRFRKALNHVIERRKPGEKIVILAHSQGTVVAAEVLARVARNLPPRDVTLLTVGSPICTYYEHFLGWDFPFAGDWWWWNYYRTADYIGGQVELTGAGIANATPTPGGHLGYWSDPRTVEAVRQGLVEPPPGETPDAGE